MKSRNRYGLRKKQKKAEKTYSVLEFPKVKLVPGDKFQGVYLGTQRKTGEFGPYEVHYFVKCRNFAAGPRVALYGSVDLDMRLMQIPRGAVAEIEFVERVPIDIETQSGYKAFIKKFNISYWSPR